MNPRIKLLFLCGFLLLSHERFAHAENTYVSPQDTFLQGNQSYEQGDMNKALELYQSLLNQGYESSQLYYNLGNVHYRRGERGKAILWYERAGRLAPRDSDIQFNLSLARSHIREDENNLLRRILLHFTNNELSWVVLILFWFFFLAWGGFTLGWIKGETWPYVHLWLSGTLLLLCVAWLSANTYFTREPLAIVISPPGEVRNGPGQEYAVGFTIPEGSKVLIMNQRPDWVQVGVPQQGLKGWMPAKEVESISLNSVLLG